MRYSDDIIEEVRSRNDIVDVVSQYVKLTRKEVPISGSAPSTMRKRRRFPLRRASRCITVSDAEREAMFLILSWNMRISPSERL